MAYQLFRLPKAVGLDSAVRALSGARAYFYETGTTTPQDTYSDAELTTPHAHPVVADASGVFPPIYLDPSREYGLTLNNSADVLIYTVDPINDQVHRYEITDAEEDAVITPTDLSKPEFSVLRYESIVNDGSTDNASGLNALCAKLKYQFFPRGQYNTESTVTRGAFSRWVGEIPQSSYQGGGSFAPEVYIFGTEANLGDGTPLVRLNADGVSGQAQATHNIAFVGNLSVTTSDLSTVPSTGVIGIDVSHNKEGNDFDQCAFRALRIGVNQGNSSPFMDKITFDRCHFMQSRLGISAVPSAGIDLVNCFFNDCYDFIDAPGADVSLVNTRLNNSSFASENTQISARKINWNGGYVEGGNRVINPSEEATIVNVYFSEMFSASGSTKFVCKPQGNNVTLVFIGCRIPTNTRLIDFTDVSDVSTIRVVCIGCTDGVNFGNTADINSYLDQGLQYFGFGNLNSEAWNVRQPGRPGRNVKNADYTLVQTDGGRLIYHSSASGHTWTIPANASVAFPINTVIDLVNEGSGAISLAITSDTLRWTSSTGTRTLAQGAVAQLRKVESTGWRLTGTGIT